MSIIKATLKRMEESEFGTFGMLYVTDEIICYTLEPPWKDNEKNVSCIPPGTYLVTRHESPRFGDVFLIHDVPDRDDILVHPGNDLDDTLGCLLPGLDREHIQTHEGLEPAKVISSRLALNLLKDKFGYNPVELTIVEDF